MPLSQSRNVGNDEYIIMCNFGGRITMKLKAFDDIFFVSCLLGLGLSGAESSLL